MQGHIFTLALVVGLTAPQTLPRTTVIAAAVTKYVSQYQRDFVQVVADELATQRVLTHGEVTTTRELRGELFSTFIDGDDRWMSVHDIQTVDGTPVTDRPDVRTLLRSGSIRELGPRLAAENARFNLGIVSRNFNEPTLALLLFTPAHVRDLSVNREGAPATADGVTLVTLRVTLDRDAPLVRSVHRRVSTRGTFLVEPDTGRIRRTTVTFDDGDLAATLDTTYAFDVHVKLWVPVTFTERYTSRDSAEVTDVTTTLSNYRRFETSGRVVK